MPPITGPGMVLIKVESLPTKEQIMERMAAPAITRRLYTLVTAITAMFSP